MDYDIQKFISRLETMQKNGDAWLTINAVLSLLEDCKEPVFHLRSYGDVSKSDLESYVNDSIQALGAGIGLTPEEFAEAAKDLGWAPSPRYKVANREGANRPADRRMVPPEVRRQHRQPRLPIRWLGTCDLQPRPRMDQRAFPRRNQVRSHLDGAAFDPFTGNRAMKHAATASIVVRKFNQGIIK